MKKQSVLLLIVITIFAMLFLAACGTSSTPTAEPTAPPVEPASEEPTAEEPAANETETTGEPTAEPDPGNEGPTLGENGVPTDIPLIDGFYDLKTEANHARIIYKVLGTNQDVVAFYVTALPEAGWDQMLGADSTIGALGTMGRKNAKTDKLTINLSFNPNGNFVSVVIDIFRAK